MPKRAKTPPPPDDEPKYLTVVHPYPLHGNWELPKDRIDFALWLACCIGKKPFYALFHKPSAPNMVIIEVERSFEGFESVLGEHRWSEVLRNPSDEEKVKVSKVYYCKLNSGREVQKHGWKRIFLDEAWFNGWSPNNSKVRYPYPKTHYCDVPVEDRTNAPICCPLPRAKFPPPPVPPAPVVGSTGWINSKKSAQPSKPARGAWARGSPPSVVIPASTRGRGATGGAAFPAINSAASRTPPNPWQDISPTTTSQTNSFQNAPGSVSPASDIQSPQGLSPVPPGLTPPGLRSTASTGADYPLTPPGLTRVTSSESEEHFSYPASPNVASPQSSVHIQMSESMEEALDRVSIIDPQSDYPAPWEDTPVDDPWGEGDEMDLKPGDVTEWGVYNPPEPKAPEIICKTHGPTCKKKICIDYSKQVKDAQREARMKEQAANSNGWSKGNQGKRGGPGRGAGKGSSNNTRGQSRGWGNSIPNSKSTGGWGSNTRAPETSRGWGTGTRSRAQSAGENRNTAWAASQSGSDSTTPPASDAANDNGFSAVGSNRRGGWGSNSKPKGASTGGWGTGARSRTKSVHGTKTADWAESQDGSGSGSDSANPPIPDPADDAESSVIISTRRSRRLSNGSTAASTTGGWGTVSNGPW